MSDDLNELILEAHQKSYERAFELAVRTGTALVYSRNGKIIEEKPPYRYQLVPIKPAKKKRKTTWEVSMTKPLPPFSSAAKSIVIGGIYEHFKKKRYKILAIARHSETLEELVVYQALYGEGGVWVRPVAMFVEEVSCEGKFIPRFQLIKP